MYTLARAETQALQTMASRPGINSANPLNELVYGLEPLVDLASTYPALFHDSFDTAFPFLLSLVSPPSAPSTNYPFSPYPPSSLLYEAYEEVANPATEILLSLAELRSDAFVSWQAGRAARELVGMLMGRLVASLQDQDEESREWLDDEVRPGIYLSATTLMKARRRRRVVPHVPRGGARPTCPVSRLVCVDPWTWRG